MQFKLWMEVRTSQVTFGDGFVLTVYENPSSTEAKTLLAQFGELRGLYQSSTRSIWLWDARRADHKSVAEQLGLDWYNEVIHGDGRFVLTSDGQIDLKWQRIYHAAA